MDNWSPKQLLAMRVSGNDRVNEFLFSKSNGSIVKATSVQMKYNHPLAAVYKERLSAWLDNKLKTNDPDAGGPADQASFQQLLDKEIKVAASPAPKNGGSGHSDENIPTGLEALPGESEADYVIRQKKIQEQAKARMRAKFGNNGTTSTGKVSMQGVGSNGGGGSDGSADLLGSLGGLWSSYVAPAVATATETVSAGVNSVTSASSSGGYGTSVGTGRAAASSATANSNSNINSNGAAGNTVDFFSQYTNSLISGTSDLLNSTLIAATAGDDSDGHFPRPTDIIKEASTDPNVRFPRPIDVIVDPYVRDPDMSFPRPPVNIVEEEGRFPRAQMVAPPTPDPEKTERVLDRSKFVGVSSDDYYKNRGPTPPIPRNTSNTSTNSDDFFNEQLISGSTISRPPVSSSSRNSSRDDLTRSSPVTTGSPARATPPLSSGSPSTGSDNGAKLRSRTSSRDQLPPTSPSPSLVTKKPVAPAGDDFFAEFNK